MMYDVILKNGNVVDVKNEQILHLEEKMGAAVMTACGAVQDGRVITGRAAGSADEFGLLCLQALKGKAAADQVAADIVYRA